MSRLAVITGLGGMNAAGRSSGFHAYKRMVAESLSSEEMLPTWRDLAVRMALTSAGGELTAGQIDQAIQGTLVRHIESFDPDAVRINRRIRCKGQQGPIEFSIRKSRLPSELPSNWHCEDQDKDDVRVRVDGNFDVLLPATSSLSVSSGGGIPSGFDPGALYDSRNHPRGLQLTVYGASDLLGSLGMSWQHILAHVNPDQVAVYAGSALGQIDDYSMGGLVGETLKGKRISTKMLAMSLTEMPADFVNSYVINSVGSTGTNIGACATFLYNLRQGAMDIQSGRARVVVVGAAEAPIVPPILEGFRVMGALAEDHKLCTLDGSDHADHRRACRPFSTNMGLVLGEAAQFVTLMDEELALSLGANILGSVGDVFVNADGNKKSISAPGIGNYITMSKAAALAQAILGDGRLDATYVHAHGTGTPQNRVTESHVLNEVAKAFSIRRWPVTSIKAYVGHSMAAAGGDQIMAALGAWRSHWIPGIKTIDHIAEDVLDSNLDILMADRFTGPDNDQMKAAIINSKGFGGNNASAVILSPDQTMQMLQNKHGRTAISAYQQRNETVREATIAADVRACAGEETIIYHVGTSMVDPHALSISTRAVKLPGYARQIDLPDAAALREYLKDS